MEEGQPIIPGGFIDPQKILPNFNLQAGMKVADFGIGGGYFTLLAARTVGEKGVVSAIDILNEPLENVRHKAELEELENIKFIRGNLEAPQGSSLGDSTQDLVLMINILFQSTDRLGMITEARRVLRDGARVFIVDWKQDVNTDFGPPPELRLNPEQTRSTAEQTGLTFEREIDAGQYHFGLAFKK